jgi:hypothetical protein
MLFFVYKNSGILKKYCYLNYMDSEKKITYFAEADFRNTKTKFGIRAKDRYRHMYIIGKTGTGKSTLIENLAVQDIQNGEGVAVIDPHGQMAERLLDFIPEERLNDVVYFAPFDLEHPIAFNVMEDIGFDRRHLVASGLMSVFKKIWADAWSARMEYILNNTILALLEYPGATLMGVNKMLSDKDFRKKVVDNLKDPAVKSFWVDEFAKYTERMAAEAIPAIQNKIGQFTANPLIRNIIGQPTSSFDIRKIMDDKKILIVNLAKGRIGEQNMNLLGGMIITKIYLAAMSRSEISEAELKVCAPLYFYVDEFQNFANESFADILSEARKYKLALTVANQYVAQMTDEVRDAILGNVGTMVTFRIGPNDAELFEKEFAPTFVKEDLVNLGFAQIYLRLMIDGMGSRPFSARTILGPAAPENSPKEEAITRSRKLYARPRAQVEEEIKLWLLDGKEESTGKFPKEENKYAKPGTAPYKPFERAFSAPSAPKTSSFSKPSIASNTQMSTQTSSVNPPKQTTPVQSLSQSTQQVQPIKKTSHALQELLKKLEEEPAEESFSKRTNSSVVPQKIVSRAVEDHTYIKKPLSSTTVPPTKPVSIPSETKQTSPGSVAQQQKVAANSAPTENRSALRDLLKKVVPPNVVSEDKNSKQGIQENIPKTTLTEEKSQTISQTVIPMVPIDTIPKRDIDLKTDSIMPTSPSLQTKKEVPEEVLKRILE